MQIHVSFNADIDRKSTPSVVTKTKKEVDKKEQVTILQTFKNSSQKIKTAITYS